jgi:hypothetical protein
MNLICLVVALGGNFENYIDVFAETLHFEALVGIEDIFLGEGMQAEDTSQLFECLHAMNAIGMYPCDCRMILEFGSERSRNNIFT